MKRLMMIAVLIGSAMLPMTYLAAHCEVPCGIYNDEARFQLLFEDQATIAKAIVSIGELSESRDAQSINQMTRWITTKETHATNTQHVIAQYFMTQKIKANDATYVDKLTAAHGVMVAAMKCKQSVDPATADALKTAITKFRDVYGSHSH